MGRKDQKTSIANEHPHEAFSAFSRSLQAEWNFILRIVPGAAEIMERVEKEIGGNFLPSQIDNPICENERLLMSLPSQKGGLGVLNPCMCQDVHAASFEASEMIVKSILHAENDFDIYELSK